MRKGRVFKGLSIDTTHDPLFKGWTIPLRGSINSFLKCHPFLEEICDLKQILKSNFDRLKPT
jgi:hypothetical protein